MPMPQVPLNQQQVTQVLQDFSTRLIHLLPPDWHQLFIRFRSVGTYTEMDAQLLTVLGQARQWTPPSDTASFFAELRKDMHAEGGEIWTSLEYHLPDSARFSIAYDWDDEPNWDVPPAAQFFQEEMAMFRRNPESTPEWLRRRSSS